MSNFRPASTPNQVPGPKALLARALKRQCPICGNSGIYKSWISIKPACPTCGYVFMRESGYFLGALAVNIIVAELFAMALLVSLLVWTSLTWWEVEVIVLPIALALPILFIPFARGLWMALDLHLHPGIRR